MRRFFPLVTKPEVRIMHVKQILTRCFPSVFSTMHATRQPVLIRSVEHGKSGPGPTLLTDCDVAHVGPGPDLHDSIMH